MDKINFRFSLLQARFPDLYQEAVNKVDGGVERKDIVADWLNELICLRNISNYAPMEKPPGITATKNTSEIELAKNIMEKLID